jgi:hypothetical protein
VVTVIEVDWNNPVLNEARIDPETNEQYVYKAYNTYVKDWLELQIPDYEHQYTELVNFLRCFNILRCVCDATREASLAHRLRANMPFDVIPFVFSRRSKSDIYKHLEQEISAGRARIPIGKNTIETPEFNRFIDQLEDLQKTYSGADLVVSHPDSSGAHDDYPDSWCLAVWGSMTEGLSNDAETRDKRVLLYEKSQRKIIKRRNIFTAPRR